MKSLMIAPQPFFQPRGTPFSVLGRLHALSELGHSVDLVRGYFEFDDQPTRMHSRLATPVDICCEVPPISLCGCERQHACFVVIAVGYLDQIAFHDFLLDLNIAQLRLLNYLTSQLVGNAAVGLEVGFGLFGC